MLGVNIEVLFWSDISSDNMKGFFSLRVLILFREIKFEDLVFFEKFVNIKEDKEKSNFFFRYISFLFYNEFFKDFVLYVFILIFFYLF